MRAKTIYHFACKPMLRSVTESLWKNTISSWRLLQIPAARSWTCVWRRCAVSHSVTERRSLYVKHEVQREQSCCKALPTQVLHVVSILSPVCAPISMSCSDWGGLWDQSSRGQLVTRVTVHYRNVKTVQHLWRCRTNWLKQWWHGAFCNFPLFFYVSALLCERLHAAAAEMFSKDHLEQDTKSSWRANGTICRNFSE